MMSDILSKQFLPELAMIIRQYMGPNVVQLSGITIITYGTGDLQIYGRDEEIEKFTESVQCVLRNGFTNIWHIPSGPYSAQLIDGQVIVWNKDGIHQVFTTDQPFYTTYIYSNPLNRIDPMQFIASIEKKLILWGCDNDGPFYIDTLIKQPIIKICGGFIGRPIRTGYVVYIYYVLTSDGAVYFFTKEYGVINTYTTYGVTNIYMDEIDREVIIFMSNGDLIIDNWIMHDSINRQHLQAPHYNRCIGCDSCDDWMDRIDNSCFVTMNKNIHLYPPFTEAQHNDSKYLGKILKCLTNNYLLINPGVDIRLLYNHKLINERLEEYKEKNYTVYANNNTIILHDTTHYSESCVVISPNLYMSLSSDDRKEKNNIDYSQFITISMELKEKVKSIHQGNNEFFIEFATGDVMAIGLHDFHTADTPTADTPTADTPTADTPTADTPTTDTPTADTPTPDIKIYNTTIYWSSKSITYNKSYVMGWVDHAYDAPLKYTMFKNMNIESIWSSDNTNTILLKNGEIIMYGSDDHWIKRMR